jgi:fatty acid/phospholipid biosynthesis enzyme
MNLYQESKQRYKPLGRAFVKLDLLHENASREEKEKIEVKYCEKYLAELTNYRYTEEDKIKLENAEKLLIFEEQPVGNVQHKKRYSGVKPIKLVNKGPIVGKLLRECYERK